MQIRTGMKRVATAVAASVVLVLGLAGCSGDTDTAGLATLAPEKSLSSDTQEQLQNAVEDAMGATGSSGAIVGVWVPWSGSWVQGVGTVAPDSKTPVSADMTFRAGHVTRAMTCDVLYELADKGAVHLDDPVTDYVGGMPKYTDITLKQLCDGTSGLGSFDDMLADQSLTNPDRVWDPRELVGYGVGEVGGDIEPGIRYRDSDAGYLLLGLALERASGKSAQELFDQRIVEPLGLQHTELPADEAALPRVNGSDPLHGFYLASTKKSGAYECDKQSDITEQSASYGSTDAGVVTDIRDVAVYTHALATQQLVQSKTRFAEPMPVSASSPTWFTTRGGAIQSGTFVGEYGGSRGYLTAAFSDPDSGLTVAVVLNNSTAGEDVIVELARELIAIAAKAPAADGEKAVAVGIPWTAEQAHDAIADAAICAPAKK
jgi:D-alanyl-D-alanine carboxypeptidase